MNEVVALLLENLDQAYEKKAWHGPTLRGAIRGLGAGEAYRRSADGRHNIWELVAHAAYWKFVARRRLTGDRSVKFPRRGSNWFTPVEESEEEWRSIVAVLDAEHKLLREAIASVTPAQLRDAKTRRITYGIAAHDLYHTGQIQLTKRLIER